MFTLRWTVIDNPTIVCLCESTRIPSAHRGKDNISHSFHSGVFWGELVKLEKVNINVWSKSFCPDVQKQRQMENAVRDI